jgi:hypothetical protein
MPARSATRATAELAVGVHHPGEAGWSRTRTGQLPVRPRMSVEVSTDDTSWSTCGMNSRRS